MATIERAVAIAAEAHAGQTDRAGQPYVLHPLRLMLRMTTADERIAAALHDVVEDSDWTLDDLRAEGFSEAVVTAVEHLTHPEGMEYMAYVERAASHPVARRVKLADLEDNMDTTRLGEVTDKDARRLQKYHRARRILLAS